MYSYSFTIRYSSVSYAGRLYRCELWQDEIFSNSVLRSIIIDWQFRGLEAPKINFSLTLSNEIILEIFEICWKWRLKLLYNVRTLNLYVSRVIVDWSVLMISKCYFFAVCYWILLACWWCYDGDDYDYHHRMVDDTLIKIVNYEAFIGNYTHNRHSTLFISYGARVQKNHKSILCWRLILLRRKRHSYCPHNEIISVMNYLTLLASAIQWKYLFLIRLYECINAQ